MFYHVQLALSFKKYLSTFYRGQKLCQRYNIPNYILIIHINGVILVIKIQIEFK